MGQTVWAAMSSPLLDRLRTEGYGVNIVHPSTNESILIPAFAFVDDTDLLQELENGPHILNTTQEALNVWEESLQTTRGALVAKKCSWFMLKHKWHNNKWSYASQHDQPGNLFINTNDNN